LVAAEYRPLPFFVREAAAEQALTSLLLTGLFFDTVASE
jgi:hypothetical protein